MKKRTPDIEADLDPPGTTHSRPGGFAAARAVAATKPPKPAAKKSPRATATAGTGSPSTTVPATPTPTAARRQNALDTIEADLDPAGSTRPRPGGFAASKAVEATKPRGKKR
jgi:hypothetical protein